MSLRSYKTASILLAVLSTGLLYASLQIAAFGLAGVVEYPLDDVYIHLAMAEEMARGGYGVNVGEVASASSSPLFPVLLMPFAGSEAQIWLPMAWNILALVGAAALWGAIVAEAFPRRPLALVFAVLGPLGLNFAGLAFTGMEHELHLLTTLSVLYGLQRYLATGRLNGWLFAGIFFGPLFRFEGLAVSCAAVIVLLATSRPKAALTAGLIAILPVALFCVLLIQSGLDPLPNSVNAKLGGHELQSGFSVGTLITNLVKKLRSIPGLLLVFTVYLAMMMALLSWRGAGAKPVGVLMFAVVFVGAGHLLLGQIGWMNRYEIYILTFLLGGIIVAVGLTSQNQWRWPAVAALCCLVISGAYYTNIALTKSIISPRAIALQQGQMERFVDDFLKAPVAVNDLGKVAHANDHYVLDLWGLASAEALERRLGKAQAGWADELVKRKGVGVAMIYDRWLGNAIGKDWKRLGTLSVEGDLGFVARRDVAFYSTGPEVSEQLCTDIAGFAATLPPGAVFAGEGADIVEGPEAQLSGLPGVCE
ncbi:hypothetical protein [Aliiroseovarius sp. YM-037]|uniref:hypothetical protein n=1 Tax=Aliiroseovarius sp. YM-037 TaxID=3341728 RepID=UPI003A80F5F2